MSNDTEELVVTLVKTALVQLSEMRSELHAHMKSEPQEVADIMDEKMRSAFPNGDLAGHRVAHEAAIQAALDRAEFWRKMSFEITKYGLFGVLGWLAYVAWQAFLQGPHK